MFTGVINHLSSWDQELLLIFYLNSGLQIGTSTVAEATNFFSFSSEK